MEDAYIIQGGKKLTGQVTLSGAKNVALKTVIAALMFEGPVTLHNIPRIRDIYELLHLIAGLGARAEFIDKNTVCIDATALSQNKLDFLHASKIRTSFLLFAPLLHRFGEAYIPNPGGCRIGARPIDRIVNGMKDLGVAVSYDSETGFYHGEMKNKPSGAYTFKKPSHTGTELLLMLSVFSQGEIIIKNAALEPEIDDLIMFLNEGGARIVREDTDIRVKGVESLKQTKPFTIVSDRNEAITYAVLALVTGGDITISEIPEAYILTFIAKIKEIGGGVEEKQKHTFRFYHRGPLVAADIVTDPHPGFMTDWQPNWALLMTQATGTSHIHERVFENRFAYVDELKKLGAHIEYEDSEVANPSSFYLFNYETGKEYHQAIRITGPKKLHNGVLKVADLRAGATLALAALMAEGETVITGVSIMERGYEDFVRKITELGGTIKKV